MVTITIERRNKNNRCVMGIFKAVSNKKKGIVTGYTLEPPDLNYKDIVSCILPDRYKAQLYESPKFGITVILLETKHGREWIEIHSGNYPRNTQGCILVGSSQGKNAVWRSRDKLNELIDFCGEEDIEVIVKDIV